MAIQYPINTETDRFTVYNSSTSSPVVDGNGRPMRGLRWGSTDVTQMISNLAPGIHWLLDVKETEPVYDPATQKLERVTTYDVANETATDGFNIVALTQQQIDAKTPKSYSTLHSPPIQLGVGEKDQNAFSRMINLINQSGMADTDMVTIKDVNGNIHPLTVADFKITIVLYGQHCYTLFMQGENSDNDPM